MNTPVRATFSERFVNGVIRFALRVVARIRIEGLELVPNGPAILVTNHTTNFEGPLYYLLLHPIPRTALGKIELWKNPVTRFVMQVWGIIPLQRGVPDRLALRRVSRALAEGKIVGLAPEGTRSRDGTLQRGRPGAALLAATHQVPVIPIVQWGASRLMTNLRRLRRTTIHVRAGRPFRLGAPGGRRPTPAELRRMTDEVMCRLAELLPSRYRGVYRDALPCTDDFVRPA